MKRLTVITALLLASFVVVLGAQVNVSVPNSIIDEASVLCDELRQSMFARSMTTAECAGEFLRRGLRNFKVSIERAGQRAAATNAVNNALNQFDADFPVQVEVMSCGDGTLDSEPGLYVEECDDGNNVDGDGCSIDCRLE